MKNTFIYSIIAMSLSFSVSHAAHASYLDLIANTGGVSYVQIFSGATSYTPSNTSYVPKQTLQTSVQTSVSNVRTFRCFDRNIQAAPGTIIPMVYYSPDCYDTVTGQEINWSTPYSTVPGTYRCVTTSSVSGNCVAYEYSYTFTNNPTW